MRPHAWVVLLTLLVFGVGYTLGIITVHVARGSSEPAPGTAPGESRHHRRWGRGGGKAPSPLGPCVGSVSALADELELSEEQRRQLEQSVERTTEAIAGHERSISNLVLEARRGMDAVLTPEQRDRLGRLIGERMRGYASRRLEEMVQWFRTESGLGEGELERVRAILKDYHEAKGRFFREIRGRESWPERREMEAALAGMRKERDRRLSEFLEEGVLQRFREAWDGRRPGR